MGTKNLPSPLKGDLDAQSDFNTLDHIHHQEAELLVENVKVNDFRKLRPLPKIVQYGSGLVVEDGLSVRIPIAAQTVVSDLIEVGFSQRVIGDDHSAAL